MPNESEHLLNLVRVALDEFEVATLSASVRRSLRIAQLRGDSSIAYLCRLDLRPTGGSSDLKRAELQAFWPDADSSELSEFNRRLIEEWLEERQVEPVTAMQKEKDDGSGLMVNGSVEELEKALALREGVWRDELDDIHYRAELDMSAANGRTVIERIRYRTYGYLCRCENELALGAAAATVFDNHRRRVDATLSVVAPDVLEQFGAAYRRSRDGDGESLAHALQSCRRILSAVANIVFPPCSEPHLGMDGKPRLVGPEQYKNRILAFLDQAQRQTAASVIRATFEDFDKRLSALNKLDSKGVHDDVEQSEVDLCVNGLSSGVQDPHPLATEGVRTKV